MGAIEAARQAVALPREQAFRSRVERPIAENGFRNGFGVEENPVAAFGYRGEVALGNACREYASQVRADVLEVRRLRRREMSRVNVRQRSRDDRSRSAGDEQLQGARKLLAGNRPPDE